MNRTRTRGLALVVLALAVSVVLAACGGDDDSSSSTATSGGSSSGKAATIGLLLPETKTARYEAHDKPVFQSKVKELCPSTLSATLLGRAESASSATRYVSQALEASKPPPLTASVTSWRKKSSMLLAASMTVGVNKSSCISPHLPREAHVNALRDRRHAARKDHAFIVTPPRACCKREPRARAPIPWHHALAARSVVRGSPRAESSGNQDATLRRAPLAARR